MNDIYIRARFELWCMEQGFNLVKTYEGNYETASTDAMWGAWRGCYEDRLIRGEIGPRECTCAPSEEPRPCMRMYAQSECDAAYKSMVNEQYKEKATIQESEVEETPNPYPKRYRLNGDKLTLSVEFKKSPIGLALIYGRSGEVIFSFWPFLVRLSWGY